MPESSALNIPHSPVAMLGTVTLLTAFVVAAYAFGAGLIGNVQHRRRLVSSSVYSLYGFGALMLLASALIIYAFVTHDYTIKYVAHYSDTSMPLYYKITAYWGGLDGSLMFWVSVLAIFAAIAVWVNHRRHRDMIGYVVAVIMGVQIFFLALLIYNKNPFAMWLTEPPVDGKGLNPLLQTFEMTVHPPSLYIGFVSATIPFAFGIAALASGRLDDQWLYAVRVWTLICWFFLTLGLVLGGWWAYKELGWGGYWAWDPVENAGLLPWFTATAFLHSVMIQEQRGMMRTWNLILVVITFFLTIFGTFMTRSGVVQSVHAFGEDNELALLFILFMVVILVLSIGLLLYRLPQLRSSNTFESFVSREFAFLLNNWILLSCAVFVLFATMFPTISEAVRGHRITVGPPFFNKWMIPLGLTLLFLAGAAPLLAWRRTTVERLWNQFLFPVSVLAVTIGGLAIFAPRTRVLTTVFSDAVKLPITLVNFGLVAFTLACVAQEFWRGTKVRKRQTGSDAITSLIGLIVSKRRKYGGYIVHVGVAVMFLGFAGKAFETMDDFTVSKRGETFSVRDYTFAYKKLETTNDDHKRADTAHVSLLDRASVVKGEHPVNYHVRVLGAPDVPEQVRAALEDGLAAGLDRAVPGRAAKSEALEGARPLLEQPKNVGAILESDAVSRALARSPTGGAADGLVFAVPAIAGDSVKLDAYLYNAGGGELAAHMSAQVPFPRAGSHQGAAELGNLGRDLYRAADFPGRIHEYRPAKWQYKKFPDQPTSEVDIYYHMEEDVYLILTGFNPDSDVANFRVYVNPLINWVWLGFFFLAVGAALCMVPQAWVDNLSPKRPSPRSRIGGLGILLLVGGGLTFGGIEVARAQAPPMPGGGAEYEEAPAHNVGVSAAHRYRPNDPQLLGPYREKAVSAVKHQLPGLPEGSEEFEIEVARKLAPIEGMVSDLMANLRCLCGGCAREPLLECKCGFAAQRRGEVLEMLADHDLWTEEGRKRAEQDVKDAFVQRAGGEHVLMVPRDEGFNRLSWMVPYAAFGGGLLLLYGFGRRWVRQGKEVVKGQNDVAKTADVEEDEAYADLLDDELRDTD